MKYFFLILIFLFLQSCSKPKTVFICGDHICINKAEAKQYFEENLTIEVKIIDKNKKKEIDLVQLNLKDSSINNRQINIEPKIQTKEEIKILSNNEIKTIKEKIIKKEKIKKNEKKVAKKNIKRNGKVLKNHIKIKDKAFKKNKVTLENKINKNLKKNDIKQNKEVVDICTIIVKCNIDEISKYLLEKEKKKSFPDITKKEQSL